jgi:hypothetical protein
MFNPESVRKYLYQDRHPRFSRKYVLGTLPLCMAPRLNLLVLTLLQDNISLVAAQLSR